MKISSKGLAIIKEFEGCYLKAYRDAVGVWTIGYGITNDDKKVTGVTVKEGVTITQGQADKWLETALNTIYAPKVAKYDGKYHWNQNQFDALISFAYNIGSIDKLTADGTRSIKEISAAFPNYNHAGGKVLAGLTRRRLAEKALFDTPTGEEKKEAKKPMTVKIGSARIDENGRAYGGAAGDQTGNEVSTQDWYLHSKGWYVIRAKDAAVREKIARNMEAACANSHIGYDQWQRDSATDAARKYGYDAAMVAVDVETDCSALVRMCVLYAGITVPDFNTESEWSALSGTGQFNLYTADTYCKNPDYLLRGDILVTRTKGHTVVVLSNGEKAASQTAVNSQTGGKSIEAVAQEVIDGSWGTGDTRRQRLAAAGYDYAAVQAKVNAILKGTTVGAGENPYPEPTMNITSRANAAKQGIRSYMSTGNNVKWVQWELFGESEQLKAAIMVSGGIDGICGSGTVDCIREYQRIHGLTQDGVCGAKTRARMKEQ